MELRRDGVMRWQEICVQLALGMGGFRIVNSGQSFVPVLLTFLHKTEEQSLVLLILFQIWNHFSVFVVMFSEGRVTYQDTVTFVEVPTCCWFKRILRTLLSWYSVLRAASKVKGVHVQEKTMQPLLHIKRREFRT